MDINGYCCEHIHGNKSKNTRKGRYSGGISFYYKTKFKKYIKVMEKQQSGIIWVKLSNELFPFEEDVYICHTYIPPNVSKVFYSSIIDLFEQLELGIVKYNNMGKVYVSGDLNSRTSHSLDYFEFDKYLDQNLPVLNTCDKPVRVNKDRVIDHYGERLFRYVSDHWFVNSKWSFV